jgi:addiction module RelB/DinJ family antitoxin
MNNTSVVTAKVNSALKSRVQKIAARDGVTLSMAISQYFRKIDRDNAIPFEDFIPNKATIRAIKEADRDYKAGKLKKFQSVEDFLKDLKKR